MNKLFVLAALCVVGVVVGDTVCIPTPNWMEVQLWSNKGMAGYVSQFQFLDLTSGFYRQTDIEFFQAHGRDRNFGQDMIIDSKAKLVYIIEGIPQDPKTWHCKVSNLTGSLVDPCLSYNATKVSTDYIGTEAVDNYYTEDQHKGGQRTYGRLLFTHSGIPVNFVTWNMMGHQEQLFLNFNQTLPTDAFTIPTICNQATRLTMPTSQLLKEYKLEGKFEAH